MKHIFATLAILALALAVGCHAQVPLPGGTTQAVGFNVFREASGGAFAQINTALITPLTYTDLSVEAAAAYEYAAASVDAQGEQSVYSNIASATIPATGSYKVVLTWNAPLAGSAATLGTLTATS